MKPFGMQPRIVELAVPTDPDLSNKLMEVMDSDGIIEIAVMNFLYRVKVYGYVVAQDFTSISCSILEINRNARILKVTGVCVLGHREESNE